MSPQIFSVLVLAASSFFVVSDQFSKGFGFNRLLFLIISLLFLLSSVLYLLPEKAGGHLHDLLTFSYSLENTVGYILIILLFWSMTMLSDVMPGAIVVTVMVSAVLVWATWDPRWRPLQSVIRSFCVLFAMMIATFGLIRRQKNGIWMVLSLMSLAFALKPQLLARIAEPFVTHNYLKAIAVFFAGKALSAGDTPLFGGRGGSTQR